VNVVVGLLTDDGTVLGAVATDGGGNEKNREARLESIMPKKGGWPAEVMYVVCTARTTVG